MTAAKTKMHSVTVAVVTGASGGIGSAVAKQLVMAGATVILVGRRLEALEATAVRINGGVPIACDVTDESDVVSLFAQVKARFGPCDILINSAGIMNAATPTVDLTADVFSDLLAVNVTGPFLTSREAFKHMKSPRNSSHMDECLEEDRAPACRGGRIVNVGSIAAFSARPNGAAYATSKAALQGLTRSLALDGRAFGIAVGAINPGNVLSELLSPEEVARRRVSEGLITPEDVAASVMMMVSLPPTANVLELTVIPTTQPLVGRG